MVQAPLFNGLRQDISPEDAVIPAPRERWDDGAFLPEKRYLEPEALLDRWDNSATSH